jgi:hypothetical protein
MQFIESIVLVLRQDDDLKSETEPLCRGGYTKANGSHGSLKRQLPS